MENLAWQGIISGTMGNLLLSTYFASVLEWSAFRIQFVGVVMNYFVASQIWWAGFFPNAQFWGVAGVIVVGLAFPMLFAASAIPDGWFKMWQEATTPVGLAALIFS